MQTVRTIRTGLLAIAISSLLPLVAIAQTNRVAKDLQPEPASRKDAVRYFPASAVQQSFSTGGALFQEAGVPYSIATSRRDKPGVVEIHVRNNDLMFVQEGSATLVTGGTVVAPYSTGQDEIRGEIIVGGEIHELSKGDVVVVPAGTPHWFKEVHGTFLAYVVKTDKR